MKNSELDYHYLAAAIDKKIYRLKDVEHRLEKVSFDVVKFRDGNSEELWQIQSAEDGDYIVSMYSQDPEELKAEAKKVEAKTNWDCKISKVSSDVNVFYRGQFITKLASSNLSVEGMSVEQVCSGLPARLAGNENLRRALLKEMSVTEKANLVRNFPELA